MTSMWTRAGLFVVVSAIFAGVGCTTVPDAPAEHEDSTSSKLSACEIAGAVTTATASVAVLSADATGLCAEGAVAATAVSGGVALPGAVVCLAPAGAAGLSAIVAILGAGLTMLTCGGDQSQITPADSSASQMNTNAGTGTNANGDAILCDQQTYRALGLAKAQACSTLPGSCTGYVNDGGDFDSSVCVDLELRQDEYQKCLDARQAVVDQCFGGTPTDAGHQQQLDDMVREVNACADLIDSSCSSLNDDGSSDENGDDE